MQTTDTKELPKRTRYYQGVIDLQLIDQGQTYNMLKPSYIIFICSFDMFKRAGIFIPLKISVKRIKILALEMKQQRYFEYR